MSRDEEGGPERHEEVGGGTGEVEIQGSERLPRHRSPPLLFYRRGLDRSWQTVGLGMQFLLT